MRRERPTICGARRSRHRAEDLRHPCAPATEKIAGTGYSVTDDASLKALPEQPAGAVFDAEEQAKYREFKEARRGAADYMAMEGEFAKYLEDVYSSRPGRSARR